MSSESQITPKTLQTDTNGQNALVLLQGILATKLDGWLEFTGALTTI